MNVLPLELKRKGVTGTEISDSMGKKAKPEPVIGTPKSMLNEFAQKNKKSLPTYGAIATAGGFLATVTFDGQEYQGENNIKYLHSVVHKVLSGETDPGWQNFPDLLTETHSWKSCIIYL